jgi:hypothetical protein
MPVFLFGNIYKLLKLILPFFSLHYQKLSMAKIKPKALLAQSKVKKGPSQISVITIFTYLVLGVIAVSSVYAAYKYWVGKGPAVTAAGVEGN